MLMRIKPITDYPNYTISDSGELRNKQGLLLKFKYGASGHYRVGLRNNTGKQHTYFVHRIVANEFLPKIHGKTFINHKDGNKLNNSVDNLEWCTAQENCQHAWDNNLVLNPTKPKKKVEQYSLNGEYIATYNSLNEARRETGIDNSCISKVCAGSRSQAGNFIWKYQD